MHFNAATVKHHETLVQRGVCRGLRFYIETSKHDSSCLFVAFRVLIQPNPSKFRQNDEKVSKFRNWFFSNMNWFPNLGTGSPKR
jgi:hypothetical protein